MNDKILDSFLENVIKEAQEMYKLNITELDKLREKKVGKAEDEILKGVYDKIQSNINDIKHNASREISNKTAQTRRELLQRREEITKQVFEKLEIKLGEFVNSSEYDGFLKKIFSDYESENPVVYCRECDVEKIKKMGFEKVYADDSIKIGGVIVEKSQAVRVNQTLDVRLEEQYEYFNLMSGISIV